MRILLTTTRKPLSRLIRWGLGEPATHMAFVFDGEIVIHSYFTGLRIDSYTDFITKHQTKKMLNIGIDREVESNIKRRLLRNIGTKAYDYGAILYFGWRVLLQKTFGLDIPKKNKWQSSEAYLCTEIVKYLPEELKPDLDFEITSPLKLYRLIRSKLTKDHEIDLED